MKTPPKWKHKVIRQSILTCYIPWVQEIMDSEEVDGSLLQFTDGLYMYHNCFRFFSKISFKGKRYKTVQHFIDLTNKDTAQYALCARKYKKHKRDIVGRVTWHKIGKCPVCNYDKLNGQ